jgi:hypothetical protein
VKVRTCRRQSRRGAEDEQRLTKAPGRSKNKEEEEEEEKDVRERKKNMGPRDAAHAPLYFLIYDQIRIAPVRAVIYKIYAIFRYFQARTGYPIQHTLFP